MACQKSASNRSKKAVAVSEQRTCLRRQIKSKKTGLVSSHSRKGPVFERLYAAVRAGGFRFLQFYKQIVNLQKRACNNCQENGAKPCSGRPKNAN
jgi:hypothetical protein